MNIPMKPKYVDEVVGVWFVFGSSVEGGVDISDGQRDVLMGVPQDVADVVVQAQSDFRERLYVLLCREVKKSSTFEHPYGHSR